MPTKESIRNFIRTEWADVRHSRVQEWSALGVVAGVHFVLVKLAEYTTVDTFSISPRLLITGYAIIAALFAILGMFITLRHRHLMRVKLNWIFQAEKKLKLILDNKNPDGIIPIQDAPTKKLPWKGISIPRLLSTSGLIVGFYCLLLVIDLCLALYFGLSIG